ncbi:glycosyltransferase family 1 protein [Naasia sp. SYSU D00948]|uniref:glycosyltransferase family 4 protein n=1 Tax=Naasia sp. SYSU D00948 TaxID=2817379 RepID=UPI001B30533C|nr:glycosyltransferase family 1 protein [Naasia sp. SYSU D00948]
MVTLRVIVDSVLEGSPRGVARYTEEITRALIATAPQDCDVEGIVAASTDAEYGELRRRLPGLAGLHKSALARRELYAAWQHGLTTVPLRGMIHSPTLLAPLRAHDREARPGDQVVVTIHDATPWTSPDSADRSSWQRAMAKRAAKHADAIVVPTHAVAEELEPHLDLGHRVRVIGGAPSLRLPANREAVARRLGLPSAYLLAMAGLQPHKALDALLAALALPGVPDIPLVLAGVPTGPRPLGAVLAEAGVPDGRVLSLGLLTDEELAVAMAGAVAFVQPSVAEGFGLSVLEAFSLGTPVLHSDVPALLEVTDGAGVAVSREPRASYPERLADAISATVVDPVLLERLRVRGRDRAKAFHWRDSAEKVWQLHADL